MENDKDHHKASHKKGAKINIKQKKSTFYQNLTPSQTKVMSALARYKFLTSSQMVGQLGIMSHEKNLNTQLRLLRAMSRPFIGSNTFGAIPKLGRLESLHYLTKRGAKILIEELGYDPEKILMPTDTSKLFYQDYFHRKFTIDCHIAIQMWADLHGIEMIFFDRYFDKVGNNRIAKNMKAKTKIMIKGDQYIIADGIFMIRLADGYEIFCLEMYNGQNTIRTINQLKKHIEVFELGSLSDQYGLDYAHQVLCVFEEQSLLEAVLERARNDVAFTYVKEFFLCKTLAQMNPHTLVDNWVNLYGEMVRMYE